MTRKEFENSPTKMHPWDGLNYKPEAQKDCKTCKGMGLVDIGDFACTLIICPDCWSKFN